MKNKLIIFPLVLLCAFLSITVHAQKLGHSHISPYSGSKNFDDHTIHFNLGETFNAQNENDEFTLYNGLLHNVSVKQLSNFFIQVRFFHDKDEDGIKSDDEGYLNFGSFSIQDSLVFVNNDQNGVIVSLSEGTYQVRAEEIGLFGWFLTSQEEFLIDLNITSRFSRVEFGLASLEGDSEINIKTGLSHFVCGFPTNNRICVMNYGVEPEIGTVWIDIDDRIGDIAFDKEPDHFIDSTQVGWNLIIDPGELIVFKYFFTTPLIENEEELGELYFTKIWVETNLGTTTECIEQELKCSYDPNDKLVQPNRPDSLGLLDEPIAYTIRFQNTGNFYAQNVLVIDTLSNDLNINTFRLIDSSHPDLLEVVFDPDNKQIVHFRFDNIFLPDSTTNELGSNGFILYQISSFENTPEDTEINNTGHIYFDFNPAIVTNTTSTTLVEEYPIVALTPGPKKLPIKLYPNPTRGLILMDKIVDSVMVLDTNGEQKFIGFRCKKLQLDHLTPGTYFLLIEVDGQQHTEKIILFD